MKGIALAAAAPLVLLAAPAHADHSGLDVAWVITDASAGAVQVRVHNGTARNLSGWEATVPFSQPVTDVSGAISIQDAEHLTLSSQETLPVNTDAVVQLKVAPLGTAVASPSWCSSIGISCRVREQSPTPPTEQTPGTISGHLTLSYRVLQDWGSGQSVVMSVRNNGARATSQWQVEVPAGVHVDGIWGAEGLSGGGVIRAASIDTNGYLAPGEAIEFGFDVMPGGNSEWSACHALVDGLPASCGIAAADSWTTYPELPSQW